ncbi:hypothetical protein HK102_000458 [Quaeritorhiza haematococci]|nr:hypothetical protein HK102_000458 [Quaeritorhiza haematococci]
MLSMRRTFYCILLALTLLLTCDHEVFSLSVLKNVRRFQRRVNNGVQQPARNLIGPELTPETQVSTQTPTPTPSPIPIELPAPTDSVKAHLFVLARITGEESADAVYPARDRVQTRTILLFTMNMFWAFLRDLDERGALAAAELEALKVPILPIYRKNKHGFINFLAAIGMKTLSIKCPVGDAVLMKIKRGVLRIWRYVEALHVRIGEDLRDVMSEKVRAGFLEVWEE